MKKVKILEKIFFLLTKKMDQYQQKRNVFLFTYTKKIINKTKNTHRYDEENVFFQSQKNKLKKKNHQHDKKNTFSFNHKKKINQIKKSATRENHQYDRKKPSTQQKKPFTWKKKLIFKTLFDEELMDQFQDIRRY